MRMWAANEVPDTDEKVLAEFDDTLEDRILKGIYQCKRLQGMNVSDALIYTLEANVKAYQMANRELPSSTLPTA